MIVEDELTLDERRGNLSHEQLEESVEEDGKEWNDEEENG
jgi:hypothetical protein